MDSRRKPFQGLTNVIQFNWPFYLAGLVSIGLLLLSAAYITALSPWVFITPAALALLAILLSLAVSFYIYDVSGIYLLSWLNNSYEIPPLSIANFTAGFDEMSMLLKKKFPAAELSVFDFYDPQKHTEPSIRRARAAYPPYPGTVVFSEGALQAHERKFQLVILAFAAHEIRDQQERIRFFSELAATLHANGRIIVLEHLRSFPNFMAYNIGFFHFHSRRTWLRTFQHAGLVVWRETAFTPFLRCFYLQNA